MSIQTLPNGTIPLDYNEVLYWTIVQKPGRIIAVTLLGLPLGFVFGAGFLAFVLLFGRPMEINIHASIQARILLLIGVILVIPLHELAHGVAMRIYGARPQYGISWKALMIYTTAPGYAFLRNQYLVATLAPLVSLSLLACCGIRLMAGSPAVLLLAICAVINGTGAIGDLWISAIILRYPAYAYIVDERNGMRVFLPGKESKTD